MSWLSRRSDREIAATRYAGRESATDRAAAKDRGRRQKRLAADRRRAAKAEAKFEARDRGIFG
ncbi:hypothetical protein [Streptomyces sp. NPDC001054]